jgi:hypothetical protein
MSRHLLMPERVVSEPASAVIHRASAGHTAGLAAWLGTDSRPAQTHDLADATPVSDSANWSAPTCSVQLAYDTADQRLPSGVRAIVQEGSRCLMFETEAYEILLRVASDRRSQQHQLTGQVLFEGLPLPGAAVRLDPGESTGTISTDRAGGFRLPPLAHGAYALSIAVAGAVLRVPPFALS